MSTSRFEIAASRITAHSFRASIDHGLKGSWGAPVMRWTWKDGKCHAWAPGATGSLHLEDGKVVATVHLSVVALPLKKRIHHDIITVLKRLGDGPVKQC